MAEQRNALFLSSFISLALSGICDMACLSGSHGVSDSKSRKGSSRICLRSFLILITPSSLLILRIAAVLAISHSLSGFCESVHGSRPYILISFSRILFNILIEIFSHNFLLFFLVLSLSLTCLLFSSRVDLILYCAPCCIMSCAQH